MSCTPHRANPTCSTSISTSSTRSRRRKHSMACASTNRKVRRPDLTVATDGPQRSDRRHRQADRRPRSAARRSRRCGRNAEEFGVRLHSLGDKEQGIVHVVGPQLGLTMPGITVVCGDSHTSTHGAFGAMAFGIGTSEVEHVLATQTLPLKPFKTMAITVEGELRPGVTAKDIVLAIIAKIGTGGGQGYVLEFRGSADPRPLHGGPHDDLQHVDRGRRPRRARRPPTRLTFAYLQGREHAPKGDTGMEAVAGLAHARDRRRRRRSTSRGRHLDASTLEPHVTWGTNPGAGRADQRQPCPIPRRFRRWRRMRASAAARAWSTWASKRRQCRSSRSGRHRVHRLVHQQPHRRPARCGRRVPRAARSRPACARDRGARLIGTREGLQAEAEGLDKVFIAAGCRVARSPGCSMCLAMNPDKLSPGERSASTSNRNFEGRQGRGGRTHLVSPAGRRRDGHRSARFATPERPLDRGTVRDDLRTRRTYEPNSKGQHMDKQSDGITGIAVPLDRSATSTPTRSSPATGSSASSAPASARASSASGATIDRSC